MTAAPRKTAPTAAAPFDMTALAAAVTVAKALPPVVRESTATISPFAALITKSHTEKVPLQTPAVPADNVKTVRAAIRRAAKRLDLGVSLREVPAADGTVVITFQAKTRTARD